MATPSLAGAPLSRILLLVPAVASLVAAVTATQPYFHLAWSPYLTRDVQLYRLVTHHLVYANSAELLLGTLVLWLTVPGLERIWGTRKLARFLVAIAWVVTLAAVVLLATAAAALRLPHRLPLPLPALPLALPSGPFALTFAVLYQSARLTPTLYTFRLLHPALVLPHRFPLYLLAALLALAQPPASLLLAGLGIATSVLWTHNVAGLAYLGLPRPVHRFLARLAGPRLEAADAAARARLRRPTTVEHSEALLLSLAAGHVGEVPLAARAPTRPRPSSPVTATAAASAPAPTPASAPPAPASETPAPRPPPSLPVLSGTSFLRPWQDGLLGTPADQPSPAQIAELSGIFPHHARTALVAALQTSEHDVARAAELLLTSSEAG